jgi:hypothetical protein
MIVADNDAFEVGIETFIPDVVELDPTSILRFLNTHWHPVALKTADKLAAARIVAVPVAVNIIPDTTPDTGGTVIVLVIL